MALRRGLLWTLLWALLLAPTLGYMHRVVHGPQVVIGHERAAQHGHGEAGDCDHGSWLAGLFAAHEDEGSCRLFDQVSHSDALAGLPVLVLPLVLCTFLLRRFQGNAVARWAASFDARGPPVLR